ncbi:MAG: HAMP domain-containing histidine kinase, partial [Pseudomonadales bacterium]|nr:HAMP domain-containing histidine kinase [Pseudomonadales bacterium]
MSHSIASRTFKTVFTGNLVSLLIILGFAWWAFETLEETALYADQQIEIEYFEKYGEKNRLQRTDSLQLISVYQPNEQKNPADLPIIFKDIYPPFNGEVEFLDKEYSVFAHAFPEGTLYMAKDLSYFEAHETILVTAVIFLSCILVISSFLLALTASRRISQPVTHFINQLRKIGPHSTEQHIEAEFIDDELNEIACSVNELLDRISEQLKRENSLISMASHELRTPVAVVLGAAAIIEKRNQLNDDDKKTLERIVRASHEMRDNITSILHLVKNTQNTVAKEPVDLDLLIRQLVEQYEIEQPGSKQRLQLNHPEPTYPESSSSLITDKALVRMLIHNLISNSLNHTPGNVLINLHHD